MFQQCENEAKSPAALAKCTVPLLNAIAKISINYETISTKQKKVKISYLIDDEKSNKKVFNENKEFLKNGGWYSWIVNNIWRPNYLTQLTEEFFKFIKINKTQIINSSSSSFLFKNELSDQNISNHLFKNQFLKNKIILNKSSTKNISYTQPENMKLNLTNKIKSNIYNNNFEIDKSTENDISKLHKNYLLYKKFTSYSSKSSSNKSHVLKRLKNHFKQKLRKKRYISNFH